MIQQSVEFYKEDLLEEVNGKIEKTGTFDMLAIPFEAMLFSFAEIIIQLIQNRIKWHTGKEPDLEQIHEALSQDASKSSVIANFGAWADLHTFLDWWLKHEAEHELGCMWFDFTTIAKLYNEQLKKVMEDN